MGIPYENYQLAYTPYLLEDIFTPSAFSAEFEVTDRDMHDGKFVQDDTNWWIRSGIIEYLNLNKARETIDDVKNRFFVPIAYIDPFDSRTEVFYDTHHLFMRRALDAVGNETNVLSFNYRTLSPTRMMDANDNISSVVVDELGLVKATAIEGKDSNGDKIGEEADNLTGFTEQTEGTEQKNITAFFQIANTPGVCDYAQLQSLARKLLQKASARLVYDFSQQPTVVASIVREQHAKQQPNSPLQISFEYTNGMGKVAMKKVQAEPGIAKKATQQADGTLKIEDANTGNQLRWVGNGRTVLNNKGNPIKQYEPYFSVTPAYEDAAELVESGVTPVMYYDAASRLIKTELPNGTFSKVAFDTWKEYYFDVNDTVLESTWYSQRIALVNSDPEKKAALKTEIHANTPSCSILDTLGRPTLGIDHNRFADANGNIKEEFYYTFTTLDIEGNALSVTDARGNVVMQYQYDLLGHRVAQTSMDAGKRWMLNNVLGNPVKTWDERKHEFSFQYDALHRPLDKRVQGGDGPFPLDHFYERVIYGENQADDKQKNLRGKVALIYDTAGKVISERYDFKGNLLGTTRIFAKDYKNIPKWNIANPDSLLESAAYTFTTSTQYDALNRPVKQITPDRSETIPAFNPAGLLNSIKVKQGNRTTDYVKNIDYDAKGQRTRILYGNNVSTKYSYDPNTFRLTQLRSTKTSGEVLQELYYTYDPTGNITQIQDKAIPAVFFNNQKIEGINEYTYDAIYRLIEASGREQNTNSPNFDKADNWNDAHAMFSHTSGDPMGMRIYTQHYQYDPVGNILQMRHGSGTNGSWTRDYAYGNKNNRLKSTAIGSNTYLYPHHGQHGYMIGMPHLQIMDWNFKEELRGTAKQRRTDGGTPETTYYVYDGNGQRARKITESQADSGKKPSKKDERLYISGYEVYREQTGLERTTLHVMDYKQRIAMIDIKTVPSTRLGTSSPQKTVRFQLGNHLGSVSLEVNENADVISYEEYHPYGTTAYQAQNVTIKAAAKRYRYTGIERDEETSLEYHSARYYISWLGRWINCDPMEIADGLNIYSYVTNNPISYTDISGYTKNLEGENPTMRELAEGRSIPEEHGALPYPDWLPEEIGNQLNDSGASSYIFEAYVEIGRELYRRDIVAVVRNKGDFAVFQMQPDEEDLKLIVGDAVKARQLSKAFRTKEEAVLRHLEEGWSLDDALGLFRGESEIDHKLAIWRAASLATVASGLALTQKPPIFFPHNVRTRPKEIRPDIPLSSGRELWRRDDASGRSKFKEGWSAKDEDWNTGRIKEREEVTYEAFSSKGDPTHDFPYIIEREVIAHGWTMIRNMPQGRKRGYTQFVMPGNLNGRAVRYEVGGYTSRAGNVFVITHRHARPL